MPAKKAAPRSKTSLKGGRVTVQFGTKKNKKTNKVEPLTGRSKEATVKALGLTGLGKVSGPAAAKDKKGRQIVKGPSTSIGTKKLMVQDRAGKWHTMRMPANANRTHALAVLSKSAKVSAFKYEGGRIVRLKDLAKTTKK